MFMVTADAFVSSHERTKLAIAPALAIGAFASIGAGAIHAAAIGAHDEHRQVVIVFTVVAVLQVGWGVLALLFGGRAIPIAGAVFNAAMVGGWVLAKTSGISFVDGLEVAEDVQRADAAAAAIATVAVVGVVFAVVRGAGSGGAGSAVLMISALLTALVTVPAMISAGSHAHADGGAHDVAAAGSTDHDAPGASAESSPHAAAVAKPYDPTKPIDLSGVEGVTPAQQARAENLIAVTLLRLPKYADPAAAVADGFRSIGDAVTGDEHYINTSYFDDGRILDPDYPESLVYEPDGAGGKKLVAAMFMMPTGSKLSDVPDVGGKLTQWHIHNNLCFTPQGSVAGLTDPDGACGAGLTKGPEMPMIHVWIRPNPCGPFAALEGVGAGQIAEGETRLCDAAHG